jgi:hypothetical protein
VEGIRAAEECFKAGLRQDGEGVEGCGSEEWKERRRGGSWEIKRDGRLEHLLTGPCTV